MIKGAKIIEEKKREKKQKKQVFFYLCIMFTVSGSWWFFPFLFPLSLRLKYEINQYVFKMTSDVPNLP